MTTTTTINYKGRVWTCDEHHAEITKYLALGNTLYADCVLRMVNPKKGNDCKECARLYRETPPVNR